MTLKQYLFYELIIFIPILVEWLSKERLDIGSWWSWKESLPFLTPYPFYILLTIKCMRHKRLRTCVVRRESSEHLALKKPYAMTLFVLVLLLLVAVTGSLGQGVSRRTCSQGSSVCRLPAETGPCLAYNRRYHFDAKQGVCKMFIYGGCRGNGNNFATLKECQASCQASGSICDLPKVVGPCKARIPRFFYNSRSEKCERFYYGGCRGNSNNFKGIHQCYQQCPCKQSSSDVCSLPKKPGPCRGMLVRYFHNALAGKCEQFIYGGCRGNANNFDSIKKCQATCELYVQVEKPFQRPSNGECSLPKQQGPCRAAFLRFFYNQSTRKCEAFLYGGCRGNANNFVSIDKCRYKCIGQSGHLTICSLPKVTGPCRGSFRRYFFNIFTKRCERFIYGGCLGNANNFHSKLECQKICNT